MDVSKNKRPQHRRPKKKKYLQARSWKGSSYVSTPIMDNPQKQNT